MKNKLGINVSKQKIADFCRRHHIKKLAVFGSALRGELGPDSDIDLLVEFKEHHVPGFFRLYEMEDELSFLFGGKKIDLRTPGDLSRYFREEVVETAEVLHYES